MAVDFGALLEENLDNTEKPKPVPIGTYKAIVHQYESTESKKGDKGAFIFMLKLQSPFEDTVDPDELGEYGDIGELQPVMRWFVWQGKDDRSRTYPFKKFLSEVLSVTTQGRTLGEAIAEAPGQELLATVKHMTSERDGEIIAVIDSVASVSEDD